MLCTDIHEENSQQYWVFEMLTTLGSKQGHLGALLSFSTLAIKPAGSEIEYNPKARENTLCVLAAARNSQTD